MKPLIFNKDSWHYRIASKYGNFDPKNSDICSYGRRIFLGLLMISLIILSILILGIMNIDLFLGIVFSFICGSFVVGMAGQAMICFYIILASFISAHKYVKWKKNRYENYRCKSDGYLINAYKSWKDKFCLQINFQDSKSE